MAEDCGYLFKERTDFRSDLHEISLIPSRPFSSQKSTWESPRSRLLRSTSAKFYKRARRQSSAVSRSRSRVESEVSDGELEDALERLPPLQYESSASKLPAFIRKLRQCHKICNFNEPTVDTKSKEVKRSALNDILDFISCHDHLMVDQEVYDEVFLMVGVNLFRDLPPVREISPLEMILIEDDDPIRDVAWVHLQLVYEILLKVLTGSNFDKEKATSCITEHFLFNLLKLFESLDSREREILKTVTYTMYCKLVPLRAYIRKEVSHLLLMFAFGDRCPHGISELLELMSSIIAGFAVPIKPQHQQFLFKVLMPLHRSEYLPLYHENLKLCMVHFIERDETLVSEVMKRLLPLWPKTNSFKTVNFIDEVDQILSKVHHYEDEQQGWLPLLVKKMATCIRSENSIVAERALNFTLGVSFSDFLNQNALTLLPILFPVLYETSRGHWSESVASLTYKLLTRLMALNSELFDYLVDIQNGNQPKVTDNILSQTAFDSDQQ